MSTSGGKQGSTVYPEGATPLTGHSGIQSNATATATLTGPAANTVYCSGVDFVVGTSTAAAEVGSSITGLLGGTFNYAVTTQPVATGVSTVVSVNFSPAIPASAVNTPIAATMGALGAGNVRGAVNIRGYYI